MASNDTSTGMMTPSRQRSFKAYTIGFLLLVILLFVLYTLFMLWWSYSEGDRAGVLQKFSKRGWICKTYEGELAMYVVGGVAPQIWDFSVRDEDVANQLQGLVGQQVRLTYSEHRNLPTDCFGETDYFVEHVEKVDLNLPTVPTGPTGPSAEGAPPIPAPAAQLPAPQPPPPRTQPAPQQ